MKFLLPSNIYSKIFSFILPGLEGAELVYTGSAVISKQLAENKGDIALIPSMDLLNHPDFFISGRTALSFDGSLSNSYFYFLKQIRMVKEIFLRGDISKNEAILTKIIFAEQFDTPVDVVLDSKPFELNSRNYLVCGDDNFSGSIFEAGISLADQISDMIDAPYVNYVLASRNEDLIKEFNTALGGQDKFLEDNYDRIMPRLGYHQSIMDNIKANLNSIYFDMTDNEKKALTDLIRLPYFTGITEEINDIKFVD